jgi:PhzF family phenazine biosynthesis protein
VKIPIYQVDAFTDRVFAGNPAAVCPLAEWLPDRTLQAIAAENNLSETAFLVGHDGQYAIRWFTPATEVDLCGHATLASAHVLFQHRGFKGSEIRFASRGGDLRVSREGDRLSLDFPSRPPGRSDTPDGLAAALGTAPVEFWTAQDWMAVLGSEEEVRRLRPDMARIAAFNCFALIVTAPAAPGAEHDFVSRFFAPAAGIPEDPVTGRAHCTLVPYWAGRLGRTQLRARQVSPRGGELWCELQGERVLIAGHAVTYLQGTIDV